MGSNVRHNQYFLITPFVFWVNFNFCLGLPYGSLEDLGHVPGVIIDGSFGFTTACLDHAS